MSKRRLSPEEKTLWDNFVKGVKRIVEEMPTKSDDEPSPTTPPSPPKKKPPPVQPPQPAPKPASFPNKSQPSRRTTAKLRKVFIEGRVDLHGLTLDQAYSRLELFLKRSQLEGRTWVLVITGKGAPNRPSVIRQSVPDWLDNPLRNMVAEYASAKPQDGGFGALYVRLKKPTPLK